MKITIEIPDAETVESEWMPKGISMIRVKQNPLYTSTGTMVFYVKNEWIKEAAE